MDTQVNLPEITDNYLDSLGPEALVDLLNFKTRHLLSAAHCQLPEHAIRSLRKEVEMIQGKLFEREKSSILHKQGRAQTFGFPI